MDKSPFTLNFIIEYFRNYIISGGIIALGTDMFSEGTDGAQRFGVDFDSLPGVPSVSFVVFFGALFVALGLIMCFWNAWTALTRLRDSEGTFQRPPLAVSLLLRGAVYLGMLIPLGLISIIVELLRRSYA